MAHSGTLLTPLHARRLLWVLLLAFAATLAWSSAASAAVTQKQAANRAVKALGSDKGNNAVIVFGLPKPVRAGTKITQAGTNTPGRGSTTGLSRKLRSAGVRVVRAPRVLTAGTRSYFFYEDRGPFQLYQHPGRVALVDVATGRVKLSRTITWPPLVSNRLPAFLKNATSYRSSKYQVFNRPWTVPGATQQRITPRNQFENDPFGPGRPLPSLVNSRAIADRLAAERSCILRVTDTLPSFWNVNELNLTRSYVGTLFEQLERDNPAFIDDRYGARSGETLAQATDRLTAAGCKDVLLYIAGQGYSSAGEPVIHLGTSVRKGGLLAQQNISATDLRNLVSARTGITFKFKIDAPYAGGFIDKLRDLPNVLLVETASAPGDEAFAYVPQAENSDGQMVTDTSNPAGLLEFTNCELVGLKAFFDSAEEIDKATQAQNEGVSFLVEMLARSQELCKGIGFADNLGANPQLYTSKRGSGKGTNLPPKADKQDVSVTEDTPKDITLGASDPNGDPLTFTITKNPDHGTLSGTGANRTYTPNANYNGTDSFSFKVEDNKGASSNTANVDIVVGAANDPPVVTSSSGSTSYVEGAPAVTIDGGLTVTDIDDTELSEATVRIHEDDFHPGDVLQFDFLPGDPITGFYDSGTGVLTLTPTSASGSAPIADMQAALRTVKFSSAHDNPKTPTRILFSANDGDGYSLAATKNLAIGNINDAPTVTGSGGALDYHEGDGAVAIDPNLLVEDPDTENIQSAVVQADATWVPAEDQLSFTNTASITLGSYNDSTGTLTLTGTATVAEYEAALRSVRYENSSDTPSTLDRRIGFQVTDAGLPSLTSNVGEHDIQITPTNDAPVATASAGNTTFNEDGAAVPIDNGLTVADVDDTHLDSATVRIRASDFQAGDVLAFVNNAGIEHSYNSGTGVLTLTTPSGEATKSDWQAALRSVTFGSTVQSPDTSKAIDFAVNDGDADSGVTTKNINFVASNDKPLLSLNSGNLTYTENAPPQPLDPNVSVSDPDGDQISGATIDADDAEWLSAQDDLSFADTNTTDGIVEGTYNDASGQLTLTGTASPAAYEAALEDVRYSNNSDNPATTFRTISVTVTDAAAVPLTSDPDTLDVTVTSVEDNPDAQDDTATVQEDAGNTAIDVLANDTDADGGTKTISSATQPANGTVVVAPDNLSLTYKPNANYCNTPGTSKDTFTYTVNGGDTATVSVTVNCVDDNPVASNDTKTVNEDPGAPQQIDVLANDNDGDGGPKSVGAISQQPANGTAAVTNGGADVSYTPNANYCNTQSGGSADTFKYTLTPGGSEATVSVTVTCVNDAPVANNDAATVNEDSGANLLTVLTNDADTESDPIEIENVSDPANGVATVDEGATPGTDKISYTPDLNYCGSDSITYTVNGGDTAIVSVTVVCQPDSANAVDDTATVGEDPGGPTAVNVLANDSDADGTTPTVTAVTQPPNGTVAITGGGTGVEYTPNANYCNTQSGGSTDDFTYTLNSGEDSATVAMTVTCVNDLTVANADSATVQEDATTPAATTIDVRFNDTDADTPFGGSKETIASETDGGNGTVTITNGGTDLTYVPNANYCNNQVGGTPDTFSYTLAGGSSANVSVTVTCVDDNPVASNDTATVNEDPGAPQQIDVLANDNDGDGGPKSVGAISQQPANGTAAVTNGGADVSYAPNANYCNTQSGGSADTFKYTLTEGGSEATVSVTVTCVNDAPLVDLNGTGTSGTGNTVSFFELPGTPVVIAPDAEVSDVDDNELVGGEITLTNPQDGAAESITVDTSGTTQPITATPNPSNGTIVLSGNAPPADYQKVIRTATYDNTALPPNPADRTVSFKVNDGPLDSNVANGTVKVIPLNTPPVLDLDAANAGSLNNSAAFTENGGSVTVAPPAPPPPNVDITDVDASDTNMESGTVTLQAPPDGTAEVLSADTSTTSISAVYTPPSGGGDGVLALSGTDTVANYELVLSRVKYNNTSENPSTASRTVHFKVNDGQSDSNVPTSSVSVTAVNDAPVNTIAAGTRTVTEDSTFTFATADLQVSDVDANTLKVTLAATNGTMTLSGDLTPFTFSGGSDGTDDSTMTFTATKADINAAVTAGRLTYKPNANYFGAATVTVTTSDEGATGTPGPQQDTDVINFNVTEVNDAPQNAVPATPPNLTVDEDLPLTFTGATLMSTSDPDSGTNDVRVTLSATNGALTIEAGDRPALNFLCVGCNGDGDGDATMTFEGTVSEVNTALDGLQYKGNLNYFGAAKVTLTVADFGTTNGAADPKQDTDEVNITVNPVNDAPSAVDDTYDGLEAAIGNTTLAVSTNPSSPKKTITGDVLDDDTDSTGPGDDDSDVDGPGPLVVTESSITSAEGGDVTMQPDGTFTYVPDPPEAGTGCGTSDSFNYTVSDQGSPAATDVGTVNITIVGCVWYVQNSHGGTNEGHSTAPFTSLASAEPKSADGDTVFVYKGDGTSGGYGAGYTMQPGERLIGEHEGLSVDPAGAHPNVSLHAANANAHPRITDAAADVVHLANGVEVRGVTLDPQGGGGICGGTACGAPVGSSGSTIDDVNIDDDATAGPQPGLELDGTTGTHTITNLTVNNDDATTPPNTATGIRLNNAGTVDFSSTSIVTDGARALHALSTNMGTSVFDSVTAKSSTAGGIDMGGSATPVTGSTTFGDGAGTDLDLTTTTTTAPAFLVNSAGTVNVPSAGTANVSASGGPAIHIEGTSTTTGGGDPGFNFDDVDSSGSATTGGASGDGINIDGLGTGTFSANSASTLTGYQGTGFDLHGGSGNITFPGTFGDSTGPTAVEVTGRSGAGAVAFSGSITDANSGDGSIVIGGAGGLGNTGGSTTFSNGTKQVNTGGSEAVTFDNSDNHTLTFSGGGLDIDTTAGNGLDATSSGTLEVSGTGNTITSGTGTALNMVNTDIANGDVTFQMITSTSAPSGINLNTTGNANGRLFVTGAGGTCTSAANCTGASIQTSTGSGVVLNNVPGGAELMRVAVVDSAAHGIHATNVAGGILLDRSAILSNGTDTAESGLKWNDVHGVTAIRGSDLIGSGNNNEGSHDAQIVNTSGTLHLTVNDNDFNLAGTDDGLHIGGGGTSTMRTSITGNRFDNNKGDGIQIADAVSTTISSDHTITGNTIDGKAGTDTDGGIVVSSDGSARLNVSTNTITNPGVSALILNPLGTGSGTTFDGTASNNILGTDTANASDTGDGLQVKSAGEGTSKLAVTNNTIKRFDKIGMMMRASEITSGGTTHLTATGNQLSLPNALHWEAAILLQAGSGAANSLTLCADVGSNTFTHATHSPQTYNDFFLDLRFNNSIMKLPGYSGTTAAHREAYFLGRNTGFIDYVEDNGIQNPKPNPQNNVGACLQPTSPNAPTAPPALAP